MPPKKKIQKKQASRKEFIMLTILVSKLPEICQMLIYKHLHRMYMVDLRREIIHNVVWVRLRSGNNYRYEFLTSRQKNYVVWEDNETD